MSSGIGMFVGGVVGATIGWFASGGTPMGAMYGWAIGSGIGSMLFPPEYQGPRLEDLKAQASQYGWPIPVTYGQNRFTGCVIWQPPLIEVATEEDAKGGPSVTSFSYYAHAAVLVCKGPVAGIRRIWANKRLVYDASSTNPGSIADKLSASAIRIYTGDETQSPDPLIVAAEGDSPAYRGWCYVVVENFALSEHYGNRLPQFEFEVIETGLTEVPDAQEIGSLSSGSAHFVASDTGELWTGYGSDDVHVQISDPATLQELAQIDTNLPGSDHPQYFVEVGNEAWLLRGGIQTHALMIYNRVTRTYISSHSPNWSSFTGGMMFDSFTGHVFAWTVNVASAVAAVSPVTREVTSSFGPPEGGIVCDMKSVFSPGFGQQVAVLCAGALHLYPVAVNYTLVNPDFTFGSAQGFPQGLLAPHSTLCYDESRNNLVVFPNAGENKKIIVVDLNEYTLTVIDLEVTFGSRYFLTKNAVYHPGRDKYYVTGTDNDLPPGTRHVLELDPVTFLPVRTIAHDDAIVTTIADNLLIPRGSNQFLIWAGGVGVPASVWKIPLDAGVEPGDVTLGEIVRDICTQADMVVADDVNAAALDSTIVKGYTIGRQMTARAAIEELQKAFFFDGVESDDKLKFVHRGGAIAVTIPEADRAAHEPGQEVPASLEIMRVQEVESPRTLEIKFPDIARDYEISSVYERRLVRQSKNHTTLDCAVVMDRTKGSQVAAVNLWLAWQRAKFSWKTGRKYAKYEPTDVVTLTTAAATYNVRITGKRENPNGIIDWEGVLEDASIYSQNGVASAVNNYPGQTVVVPGSANMTLMDIPIMRDEDNDAGFYGAFGSLGDAAGCNLFKSTDGTSYSLFKQFPLETPVGSASTVLATSTKGNVFDHTLTVDVVLVHGELVSDTQINVLNGKNIALLGNELIQFKTATLQAANTYRLSGLLRGRFGTEREMGTHVAGERFVLVDETSWRRLLMNVSEIGLLRFYKAPLFGASLSQAAAQQFTNTAVGLKPYAGCQLAGARDGSNNLTITWKRRTRLGGAWRDLVDVSLGETSESYEVEVWDSTFATLKRTITGLSSPSAAYSAADQTTDFGSPQATVYLRVYQLSSTVGRGFKLEGSV